MSSKKMSAYDDALFWGQHVKLRDEAIEGYVVEAELCDCKAKLETERNALKLLQRECDTKERDLVSFRNSLKRLLGKMDKLYPLTKKIAPVASSRKKTVKKG